MFAYFIAKSKSTTNNFDRALLVSVVVISIFQIALWGMHLIKSWKDAFLRRQVQSDPSIASAMGLIHTSLQTIFIVTVVLIGLSNLGVDIGALLAGLGVGGIAIALAAQNILGDLLASLSIVLDKPFVVGDFIVTGDDAGTVENIGIKTTRLRSLSGEELIFSNKILLDSRVKNYKRMWQRRVVQNFGVVYSTSANILEQIPTWVKQIVEQNPEAIFDRCHFAKYGDSSLDFELVFWVKSPEYNIFMDCQQKILIDIFKKFTNEKVDFAFPTRTLVIENLPKNLNS